jgi:hypothetical protein
MRFQCDFFKKYCVGRCIRTLEGGVRPSYYAPWEAGCGLCCACFDVKRNVVLISASGPCKAGS